MPAFDYASLRDSVVQPLLSDFGVACTLHVAGVPTGQPYDPQPGADTTHAAKVVRTVFSKEDRSEGTVQVDDVAFLLSPEGLSIDPSLAHRIQVESEMYQVVKIKPLRPGPTTMLWKVHARK